MTSKNLDFLGKGPEKSPEKSPETKIEEIEMRKEAVIGLIKTNASVSRASMARELGITDRQVRTVLEQLKKEGRIHFEGTGKGGKWIAD